MYSSIQRLFLEELEEVEGLSIGKIVKNIP